MWIRSPWPSLFCLLVLATACSGQTPEARLLDAREALAAGDPATANIHLRNLLQQEPAHMEGRRLLGEVSVALGDFQGAEVALRRALELGADRESVQLPLLNALIGQGDYEGVIDELDYTLELPRDDQVAQLLIAGAAYASMGTMESASASYQAALRIAPESLDARTGLAQVLVSANQIERARQILTSVLADDENHAGALLVQGSIDLINGAAQAAKATFGRVAALGQTIGLGRYATALSRLVELHLSEGDLEQAAQQANLLLSALPDHPAARFLDARIELERGNQSQAENLLQQIVADFPRFAPAYRVLGVIDIDQGQPLLAAANLQQAINLNSGDTAARLLLAGLRFRDGEAEAARQLLGFPELSGELDSLALAQAGNMSAGLNQSELASEFFAMSERSLSDDPTQLLGLSNALVSAGELDRASELLSSAGIPGLEMDYAASYLLAQNQARSGDFDAAEATASRLIEENPGSVDLLALRATIRQMSGNYDEARARYAEALEVDPDHVPTLIGLGITELRSGNHDRAEEVLTRASELAPDSANVQVGLAMLASARNDLVALRAAVEGMPDSATKFAMLGQIELAEGNPDAADTALSRSFQMNPTAQLAQQLFVLRRQTGASEPESILTEWLAVDPADTDTSFIVSNLSIQEGEFDAAQTRLEAILQQDPWHAAALNNLAWIYDQAGDARALDVATRAYKAAPHSPAVADTLGWLLVRQGDTQAGLRLLEQAATDLPDEAEIQYHWGAALAESGQTERAADVLAALLDSDEDFPDREEAEARLAELQ